MRFTKVLALLMFMAVALFAEDKAPELRSKYGIFGNLGYNMHTADFSKVPDCPSCSPGYRDGNGFGFALGLAYELPFSPMFALELRLSYYDFSAKLTRDEATTVIQASSPVSGTFQHSFDATLNSLGLEPMLKVQLFDNFYLNAGLHLGMMLTKNFTQKEEITSPKGATFLDGNTDTGIPVRNNISGELKNTPSMYIAPLAGLSYQMPMNKQKTLLIEPEIYYTFGLSKIVSNDLVSKWSANSLRFGLALKYSPKESVPMIDKFEKIYKIDTVKVESDLISKNTNKLGIESSKQEITENDNIRLTLETISRTDTLLTPKQYKLTVDVVAVGVDKDGNEITNPVFEIEEFATFRLEPLLNYIFFDNNSSELSNKYAKLDQQSARNFVGDSLFNSSTLDIYYNLLNIVAERMNKYSNATITLTGCNSDLGEEKGNKQLSQSRAETVKNYFVNTWGIDVKRISIVSRNLPALASTPSDDIDKSQENRRVEITSNNSKIIEPLQIENIQKTANPPIVRFKQSTQSEAGISDWTLRAAQKNNNSAEFIASGKSNITNTIDWALDKNQKLMPNSAEPIQYSLELADNKNNKTKSDPKDLDIKYISIKTKRTQNTDDYLIEKFKLILFDFDQSKIEKANNEIIALIKSRIKPDSEIEIIGYTDRTGDAEYNRRLSERRAEAVSASIDKKDANYKGVGEDVLLYDNNSPEGRFYCRTVEITIRTKVK